MTAQLIDGNALAARTRADVSRRVQALKARNITPGLAVILVGEDPASQVYVRHKVKDSEEAGLHSVLERHPATLSEAELLARIDALNKDQAIHGILVQLPLPKHIDAARVIESISPAKDVDGFHVASAGALVTGQPGFWPCTPYGCMKMLESIGYELRGKHAVVIGRSNIVGKPMAALMMQNGAGADATVTVCHSRTRDLAGHVRRADIVVAAIGRPEMITGDMLKPGAVVVDVGINRVDDPDAKRGYRLVGDVHFASAVEVASQITPVPGGVGPMTIAMLMRNTVRAAERALAQRGAPA
jgi:methylenetetrahydrofolate dehydrogenase (NADP+) / methenyltetrahydrofolate cyclohydrolase